MKNIWFIALISIVLGTASCSKDEPENEIVYTVTFNTGGGNLTPESQRVKEGETAMVPTTNPSKTGYVFMFWHLTDKATPYNFNTPIAGNITLQAKWEEEANVEYFQVVWELNGGSWPTGDNHAAQVAKGGTLTEPATPVKSGYTFDGWYKDAALTNKITFPYDISEATSNFTLYAKWNSGNIGGENPPTALYIAGRYDGTGCYWKVDLSTGNITRIPLTVYGEATDITVVGNDVYVSGWDTSDDYVVGGVILNRACYWKNGIKTFLSTGMLQYPLKANAIAVSGSNVYVVGNEEIYNGTRPFYWKNGERTTFSSSSKYSGADDIFISGSNVYIAGWEGAVNEKKETASYWKNGNKTVLTDGQYDAETSAIFVSGTDVYVAGRQRGIYRAEGITTTRWRARYWKNGSPVSLTDGPHDARIYGITVSDSKVYATGYEDTDIAFNSFSTLTDVCYWENGNKITLEQLPYSNAYDIAVAGKNVYVTGVVYNVDTKNYIACFWKNGIRIDLTDSKKNTEASAIALSWE